MPQHCNRMFMVRASSRHIIGLVWSGGYGVQRKVAGSEQVLRSTEEVLGMGLMGLGGLIAIVGGVMFVVIVAARVAPSAQGQGYMQADASACNTVDGNPALGGP